MGVLEWPCLEYKSGGMGYGYTMRGLWGDVTLGFVLGGDGDDWGSGKDWGTEPGCRYLALSYS